MVDFLHLSVSVALVATTGFTFFIAFLSSAAFWRSKQLSSSRTIERVGGKGRAKIAFVHPDLGIGGAERLVVDAAVGLQKKHHEIVMYTSHHNPAHAFKETFDGTLTVKVYGDFFPRSFLGRFHILFATLRGIYLSYALMLLEPHFDVLIVDQLSIPVALLRLTTSKIIFYCHFPDLKLAGKTSFLKKLYRLPFDFLEEQTTLMAHRILVNSKFTAGVFQETFRSARSAPDVLYPSINLASYDVPPPSDLSGSAAAFAAMLRNHKSFVSINRFERKKNLPLCLKAYALLRDTLPGAEFAETRLVVAGGWDPRVAENVEHKQELEELAKELGVAEQVVFKASFSNEERALMLSAGLAVVYTPSEEHFGIVPLEAMYCRRPVVACNSGGPTESVLDNSTGFLCDATPKAFALSMQRLLQETGLAARMGEAGRQRVGEAFSLDSFARQLDSVVQLLLQ